MNEYDPQLHGTPEQPNRAPQRWLGLLIVLAVVCAVVALMGGAGTLPMYVKGV
ncbi:hypothetical protein [Aquamicrobium soli]|uniref:Uncharacterized protein n=1 Tax=Aquamicrobium soli TaxID=1811518 RepID=A0ABV7K928_9HYPH